MISFLNIKQRIYSVEIVLRDDNEPIYRFVTFTKKGKQIDFLADDNSFLLNEIPNKYIKKNNALVINITGKGVITKLLEDINESNPKNIIQNIFPDTNPNDFYCTIQNTKKGTWLSIVRKSAIAPIVEVLISKGVFITGIYSGAQVIHNLIPYINSLKNEIRSDNFIFNITDGELSEIISSSGESQMINVSDDRINSNSLIALGGAFHHFFNFFTKNNDQDKEVLNMASEHKYYIRIMHISKISLISAFIILLVNYFLFDSFSKTCNALDQKVSAYSGLLSEHDTLSAEFTRKKDFLETAGLLGSSKISFYADRLASEMPYSILLETLEIFPVRVSDDDDSQIIAQPEIIMINGLTPNPVILNDWVKCLSTYNWINKVTIQNYSNSDEQNCSKFVLEINIQTGK